MKAKIASDIHGAYDALAQGLQKEDLFFGLGDYLNLVDYNSMDGILSDILGRDIVETTLNALARGERQKAREIIAEVNSRHSDLAAKVMEQSQKAYAELVKALPCRSYLIWGNVDVPGLLQQAVQGVDRITVLDSLVTTIGSTKIGMLSGMPPGPFSFGLPGERPAREYSELLYNFGPIDALLVHPPPRDSDLSYDTIADRDEEGSQAVLDYIERVMPKRVFFGHVHSPKITEKKIGETRCLNTGYFRNHKTLLEIDI